MRPTSGGDGARFGSGGGTRFHPLLLLVAAASSCPTGLGLSAASNGGSSTGAAGLRSCPKPSKARPTRAASKSKVQVLFSTDIDDVDLSLIWVSDSGAEKVLPLPVPFTPFDPISEDTYPGHVFRIYAKVGASENDKKLMIFEYVATQQLEQKVFVSRCKEIEDEVGRRNLEQAPEQELLQRQQELVDQLQGITSELARRAGATDSVSASNSTRSQQDPGPQAVSSSPKQRRASQFEALRHQGGEGGGDFAACEPAGASSRWSCVRRWPADVCEKRHQNIAPEVAEGKTFGFEKAQGKWKKGSYEDHEYDWQQPRIPQMSKGPGFLVMNMTDRLRDTLLPWYAAEVKKPGKLKVERPVPGGYINDEQVKVDHLNLDVTPEIRSFVVREMKEILEWWTGGKTLKHQATFGARVYRRGNVLLNHVDRMDSHIVSAILQLHQDVDEDGGWPVEILSEDRECYEVYLQPGEMVLYEGARFKHGRPMAFRGEAFANVFTHFRPEDWTGVSTRKEL